MVSSADDAVSMRSAGVGGVGGRSGRPSWGGISTASFVCVSCRVEGIDGGTVGGGQPYLFADRPEFFPHQPREDVLQKRQVDVGFLDFEFGVAGVEGEG